MTEIIFKVEEDGDSEPTVVVNVGEAGKKEIIRLINDYYNRVEDIRKAWEKRNPNQYKDFYGSGALAYFLRQNGWDAKAYRPPPMTYVSVHYFK